MRQLIPFFALLILSACNNPTFTISNKPSWLPSEERLSQGFVSKFYKANLRGEGKRDGADIVYRSYRLIDNNLLEVVTYNAGYQMESMSVFSIENQQLVLESQQMLNAGDTIESEIRNPIYYSWDSNNLADSDIIVQYNENAKYQTKSVQLRVFDVEAIGKKGVSFEFNATTQNIANESGQVRGSLITTTFIEGLGLFAEEVISGERTLKLELLEQFPLSEFKSRSNNGLTRVAYIDPAQKIDSLSGFSTCGKQQRILDYYNTTPYAHYTGGNFELQEYIIGNLNSELLNNESGYLVYRFVINCEGKAGWFVTEQYDLGYQPIKFNPALVDHLLKLMVSVKSWTPGNLNGTDRDAYVYVSFKIRNGQLIEIIP